MAGSSPNAAEVYCQELLSASFQQSVVPAALMSADAAADNALSMVGGTLGSIGKQGDFTLQAP